MGASPISSISSRPRWTEMSFVGLLFLQHRYSGVSRSFWVRFLHSLRRRLELTTETLLKAIAALAVQGANIRPNLLKTPAARGIPGGFRIPFTTRNIQISWKNSMSYLIHWDSDYSLNNNLQFCSNLKKMLKQIRFFNRVVIHKFIVGLLSPNIQGVSKCHNF